MVSNFPVLDHSAGFLVGVTAAPTMSQLWLCHDGGHSWKGVYFLHHCIATSHVDDQHCEYLQSELGLT